MNGYSLTKDWFQFARENLDKVKNDHTAMYFYIVELFNKNQWVDVLGLPTDYTMTSLNIRSYKRYKVILDDLIEFKKIKLIERSKNQFTSNKIALVKNAKATTKAKPLQVESIDQSKLSILKHINIETLKLLYIDDNVRKLNLKFAYWLSLEDEKPKENNFSAEFFLQRWKDARLKFDGMETRITELNTFELLNFNKIKSKYSRNEIEKAMQGLFLQKNIFKTLKLRPRHFLELENFEKYLTCYSTKEQLFANKQYKKPIERI